MHVFRQHPPTASPYKELPARRGVRKRHGHLVSVDRESLESELVQGGEAGQHAIGTTLQHGQPQLLPFGEIAVVKRNDVGGVRPPSSGSYVAVDEVRADAERLELPTTSEPALLLHYRANRISAGGCDAQA